LDHFGPARTKSIGGKRYGLIIIDDYTISTWVRFLNHKNEAFRVFSKFMKHVQNEKSLSSIVLRNDHDGEFENENFQDLCENFGIKYNSPLVRHHNNMVQLKEKPCFTRDD